MTWALTACPLELQAYTGILPAYPGHQPGLSFLYDNTAGLCMDRPVRFSSSLGTCGETAGALCKIVMLTVMLYTCLRGANETAFMMVS